ncbi:hypothetical protein BAUCODRAFT_78565 [Baudoinia panamericana UAMH 10762]|uniref:DUF8004 domain-containing protein n=1 Tax=Baudoinia panamericana (strain UAMH 10762) TaxID=717646 RepID=M2LEI2_BAUPA|nr:uncharacterized protein BAUCODRAFT_78565 [Baudoinia panamericana UAMH 10762]EMC92402.1 hypothetical protein BAUCODRAFT_78565 [Baudoinia panamericana UAMH 10762]
MRAPSGQHLAYLEPTLPDLSNEQRGGWLPPPPPIAADGAYGRSSSVDRSRPITPQNNSRPVTPNLQVPDQLPATPRSSGEMGSAERKKKHGWFGKSKKDSDGEHGPTAWIAGHSQTTPYDTDALLAGRPLQELWDESETATCFIYLYQRNSGKSANFKLDPATFAASPVLTRLAYGDVDMRMQRLQLHNGRALPETHLFLPIRLNAYNAPAPTVTPPSKHSKKDSRDSDHHDPAVDDMQTLVDIRNFFAFLCGQALIATERKSGIFQIFMSIASILKTYEFSNVDGSTFGDVASSSFDSYVEELNLGDVRKSREKTLEAIVLGERMKSVLLYNEAFTHAVGKHAELVAMRSPTFRLISPITQNRLIRAAMDLEKRVASIYLILDSFEFPSLFTGIMNSKVSAERKEGVRFDEWKDAWFGMRKWVMSTYQQRYGHWPPKAKSKKNDLETSGLNRLVLRDVYNDMSSLYDLLVDRTNLTTRTVDGIDSNKADREEATPRALRAVLSEYDRSSPPVKPPVPFDLPLLPDLRTTRPEYGTGDKKADLKAIQKRLKDDEIARLLRQTYNPDVRPNPFIDAFRDMEHRAAHHCTIAELVDLRLGQWIFVYVVLQALPMLACDAPGVKWGQGVEYFLCEPPKGGVPWSSADAGASGQRGRTWFSVGDGGGVVSLPSDVVEHGVEGIYRRSHCWQMAERWSASNPLLNSALHEQEAINAEQSAALGDGLPPPRSLSPLPDPSMVGNGMLRPDSRGGSPIRGGSPMANTKRHSSLGIGLEALPMPVGVVPDGRTPSPDGKPRNVHPVDASKTFDAILADVQGQKKGKKR